MVKNKTIFIIYYYFLNSKNGSNTHILELLHNMGKYKNVTLFAMKSGNDLLDMSDVKYIPLLNKKYCIGTSYEFSLFLHLLYYFIKNKPDVIYLRQNSFSFLPTTLCKIFNIPLIIEINGLINDELLMTFSSKSVIPNIYSYLSVTSEKFNYKHCDKIVSVTQNLKETLTDIYNIDTNKIIVINNGANTDIFKPLPEQESLAKLNLDSSKNYICFVGNLAPWQGVEFLIKAAPLILKKHANARFLIVGDGVMKKEWMKLAGDLGVLDKFIFTGGVPYEMVPTYINAADVCVAPFIKKRNSRIGLSALKMYEYLACGKPVVASDILGVKELLENSGGGISVIPENPEAMANAILKLLSDESVRKLMGENGRKYVVTNHSWDSVARKVLDVCNDVIKNH